MECNTCEYITANGSLCGKRCMRSERCYRHRDSRVYAVCTAAGCTTRTRSQYAKCCKHNQVCANAAYTARKKAQQTAELAESYALEVLSWEWAPPLLEGAGQAIS